MANREQVKRLRADSAAWNQWRLQHQDEPIDLSGANLSEASLSGADLHGADLSGANLSFAKLFRAHLSIARLSRARLIEADLSHAELFRAHLHGADLRGADLSGADLDHANLSEAWLNAADLSGANLNAADLSHADLNGAILSKAHLTYANLLQANLSGANLLQANLIEANLSGANLSGAVLHYANLREADLSGANLREADLSGANLIETNFNKATLTNCFIYGASVWNVRLKDAKQENLNISRYNEPTITVDNLEVAQFIYLLLNNEKIRDVINTITTKAVLILGRFTPERKIVLDALREELRKYNYLPILFDFEKPTERNLTEMVKTLAHLARFIIADLTEPSSIPHELQAIIPTLAVPVRPILLEGKKEYGMFPDFSLYSWVLPIWHYKDQDDLLNTLKNQVIDPSEQKARELEQRKMGK